VLVEPESSVRGAPNEIGAERVRALVRLHDPQPTRTRHMGAPDLTCPHIGAPLVALNHLHSRKLLSSSLNFLSTLTKASGPKSSTVKARGSLQSVVGKRHPQGPSGQALLLSLLRIEFPAWQRSSEICSGRSPPSVSMEGANDPTSSNLRTRRPSQSPICVMNLMPIKGLPSGSSSTSLMSALWRLLSPGNRHRST